MCFHVRANCQLYVCHEVVDGTQEVELIRHISTLHVVSQHLPPTFIQHPLKSTATFSTLSSQKVVKSISSAVTAFCSVFTDTDAQQTTAVSGSLLLDVIDAGRIEF